MSVLDSGDGWPPDGAPGMFLGYDVDNNVAILRWEQDPEHGEPGNWYALRWVVMAGSGGRHMPQCFRRGDDVMDFVIRWARVAPNKERTQ